MTMATRTTIRKRLTQQKSIGMIKNELDSNPGHSMASLARFVCAAFSFVSPTGKLRTAACQVVLKSLANRGEIVLPKSKRPGPKTFTSMARLNAPVPLPGNIPETVAEMRNDLEIFLIPENDSESRKIWNELMATEHPLGEARLFGYQLKYLIKYAGGYVAACGFSSSALKLDERDKWINWTDEERERHQSRVLNMSRFLIRNEVSRENLASHLLSRILRRFKTDFKTRYGISPWLVETFVDTERYSGVCHKAANWRFLGKTKGRGRNDRYSRKQKSVKDIYIYPLEPEFRSIAGLAPPGEHYEPMDVGTGLSSSEWAEQEFGGIDLGDARLSERLVRIAYDKGGNPPASYPKVVDGDRYAMKGYYGFLANDNEEITFERLLSRHRGSTIRRVRSRKTVIAIQDTCDLNYSGLKNTAGLGKIGKNGKNSNGSLGLALHSVFVVDKSGLPLGIAAAECAAPRIDTNRNKQRTYFPIEEKESFRWLAHYRKTVEMAGHCPGTEVVSAMDREADIFELLEVALANRKNAPVVIRAQHDRYLTDSKFKLFERLEEFPVSFTVDVDIPPQRAREKVKRKQPRPYVPAGVATLKVSHGEVTIKPPKTQVLKNRKPLTLNAVYAREENPPEGADRIEWRLLTTLKVNSPRTALKCVEYYKLRWRIEEFHRVLKSGCGVQKHKQGTADKLRRVIAIDMVVAWRVMLLTLLGRKCPDMPVEVVFDEHEALVMNLLAQKKKLGIVVTVEDAVNIISTLGGHRIQSAGHPPGFESMWAGVARLYDLTYSIRLAEENGMINIG